MKKLSMILMAALLVLAFSCKKEKNENKPVGQGFNAYLETQSGDSKTYLGPDGHKVCWETTDAILVSNGSASAEFSLTTIDPNNGCAHFDASVQEGFYTGNYTAYYPKDLLRNGLVYLDHEQTYVELNGASSFAKGANPMVAYSSTNELHFSNICGMLALPLKGTCTVKSIQLSAKGTQNLWGTGQLNGTDLGTLSNGGTSITLDCGTGITLDANTPKTFYFVLPPVTLAQGVDVLLTDSENKVWKKSASTSVAIHKNSIRKMQDATVVVTTPVTPAVTLTGGCTNNGIYNVTTKVTIPSAAGTQHCVVGIVYSTTNPNPEIGGEDVTQLQLFDGNFSGSQSYTVDIPEQVVGVTYHVRAYAMCEGMAYSSMVDMAEPAANTWPNGQSPYPFTVGPGNQVYFSQGNLQYLAKGGMGGNAKNTATSDNSVGGTWRFAEHQWDYIGEGNNITPTYTTTSWIDVYCWSTSGYNHNNDKAYQPWNRGKERSKYYAYNDSDKDLYSPTGKADWGYNQIYWGENTTSGWRTMTSGAPYWYESIYGITLHGEFSYLLEKRENASELYGLGKVGCTHGLIILPDKNYWVEPVGLSFTARATDWDNKNVYSYADWAKMESAGAVFLPAAGCGQAGETTVSLMNQMGYYWASNHNPYTISGFNGGVCSYFFQQYAPNSGIVSGNCYGHNGLCTVRLVKDAN